MCDTVCTQQVQRGFLLIIVHYQEAKGWAKGRGGGVVCFLSVPCITTVRGWSFLKCILNLEWGRWVAVSALCQPQCRESLQAVSARVAAINSPR